MFCTGKGTGAARVCLDGVTADLVGFAGTRSLRFLWGGPRGKLERSVGRVWGKLRDWLFTMFTYHSFSGLTSPQPKATAIERFQVLKRCAEKGPDNYIHSRERVTLLKVLQTGESRGFVRLFSIGYSGWQ